METTTLEPLLAKHPLFRDLKPHYVELLCECAANVRFASGEKIFRYGESADRFFLIREGRVAVEISSPSNGALTIQTLENGEVLGWSWLFPPYTWYFDARAVTMTRALALDARCLRTKCEEDPALGYELMKRFSSILHARMQAARLQLMDVYGPTAG